MNNPAKVIQITALAISLILFVFTVIAYIRTNETYIICIGSLFFLTCITTIVLLGKYKGSK